MPTYGNIAPATEQTMPVSSAEVTAMQPAAREAIDKCFAILGTKPDPFRNLWTQSSPNERRIFCLIAGVSTFHIDTDWLGLKPEQREQITNKVRGMQKWLNPRLA